MPDLSPDNGSLLSPSGPAVVLTKTDVESPAASPAADPAATTAPDGGPAEGYEDKKLGIVFWVAVGWMVVLIGAALLAPWLSSKGILADPNRIDVSRQYARMSSRSWLGTDALGRDHLSRLIWGARVSLPVGFAAITLGLVIGAAIGLLSGYLKGWVDSTFMVVMDIVLAFPALLLALSIVTFMDRKDVPTISLAIGVIGIPGLARLVRANTLSFREREFVLASRAMGASHGRIIMREILPNVIPPVVSFAIIGVAVAIAAEAYLAFVGVSVPLPTSTWGGMILQASSGEGLSQHPFTVFLPCGVLVLTIVSLYFIGDRLGQLFNVKESAL
jgi:peptide/nickel transport system permease protein